MVYYNRTNTCDICKKDLLLGPGHAHREYSKGYKKGYWTGRWLCHACYNHYKILENGLHDLDGTRRYNDTNSCEICGNKLEPYYTYKEYDKKRIFTGRWICKRCHERFDPNSNNNLMKSLRNRRTGNLNNISQIFGNHCEELTKLWLNVKIIGIENDNFNLPLDHTPIPKFHPIMIGNESIDLSGKIVQTTGKKYDHINEYWSIRNLHREWNKEFDYEICYCTDKNGNNIERIYIIPCEVIYAKTGITIIKNSLKRIQWYEEFRLTDENEIIIINDIWNRIINERTIK